MVKGKNVASMAAFKQHASLNIHGDSGFEGLAKDGSMGQFGRITSLADLPADQAISDRLKAGEKRVLETGSALVKKSASVRKAKPELPIPDDFANALKSNPTAMATLEAFAPSHRREYVEWIIEAKRAETRARRVAQAIKMLADGKKRNWKYENC